MHVSSMPLRQRAVDARTESPLTRWVLIGVALLFLLLFLVIPLIAVFSMALQKGAGAYVASLLQPETWSAIKLTLLAAAIAVPLNLVFGLCASWAIARFRFPGRNLLVTLIDLPFSVSPVIAGLIFVLLFGRQGWLGPWLAERDL